MGLRAWLDEVRQARPEAPSGLSREALEAAVAAALATVYDPEIPVNILDLGLIYGIEVDAGRAHIRMTLTSPACAVAQSLPEAVAAAARGVPGIREASVELVWDPPWSRQRMSEAARLELGLL